MSNGINFPQITSPFGTVKKNPDGSMAVMLNQAWFQLLLQLFVRTGSAQGGITDGQLTEGQFTSQIEYLEGQVDEIETYIQEPVDYQQAIQDAALAAPSVIPASSVQGIDVDHLVTSVTGTAHQVIANPTTGDVVLTLPQNIDTTSTPTFAAMTLTGALTTKSGTLVTNTQAYTDGSAGNTATLTNAPAVGNPTKWIPLVDNGITRYVPTW